VPTQERGREEEIMGGEAGNHNAAGKILFKKTGRACKATQKKYAKSSIGGGALDTKKKNWRIVLWAEERDIKVPLRGGSPFREKMAAGKRLHVSRRKRKKQQLRRGKENRPFCYRDTRRNVSKSIGHGKRRGY